MCKNALRPKSILRPVVSLIAAIFYNEPLPVTSPLRLFTRYLIYCLFSGMTQTLWLFSTWPRFPRGFAIVTYIIKMLSRCRGAWGIPCSRASHVHWKMGLTVKNTWSRAANHVPWRVNCLFSPAGDLTDELLHSTGSEFQSARLLFDSLDNMPPVSGCWHSVAYDWHVLNGCTRTKPAMIKYCSISVYRMLCQWRCFGAILVLLLV